MGRGALGSIEEELEDSEDDSSGSSEEDSIGNDEKGSEEDSDGDVDENSEAGDEDGTEEGAAEGELFSIGDGSEDSVIDAGALVSNGTWLLASPDPQPDKRNAEDTKANIFLTLFFIRSFLLNGFAYI